MGLPGPPEAFFIAAVVIRLVAVALGTAIRWLRITRSTIADFALTHVLARAICIIRLPLVNVNGILIVFLRQRRPGVGGRG